MIISTQKRFIKETKRKAVSERTGARTSNADTSGPVIPDEKTKKEFLGFTGAET